MSDAPVTTSMIRRRYRTRRRNIGRRTSLAGCRSDLLRAWRGATCHLLDALYDVPEIAVVSARHEGAAANMAEADGKLTGRPGICFVTRGPGATHASIGVHTAFQDSTPMVLFIGQVARDARDREGFQEIDFRAMFAPLAKWVAEIDDPARIPEYLARAFRVALSGRPGPVVLSLPEDMLSEKIAAPIAAPPAVAAGATVRAADLQLLVGMLEKASRPLIVVGGSGWGAFACNALLRFAQKNDLPIVASFRRQDLIDNREANYCGHLGLGVDPSLAERVRSSDLIVAIGSRLGENTTSGYSLLTPPVPKQELVHVHPDPNELGRVYQPQLAIACGVSDFANALVNLELAPRGHAGWLREARDAYVKFSTPPVPDPASAFVDLAAVMARELVRASPKKMPLCAMGQATTRSGCTAFSSIEDRIRSWRRSVGPWAMGCRLRLQQNFAFRAARSWRSPETAAF